ncbi:MAG: hypothetical protein KC777_09885 [Cyanobacteria bacterium HKST-UBA02]|nr:hypothetical protein [Cyanobacteria bacterium HKST-UBA02]
MFPKEVESIQRLLREVVSLLVAKEWDKLCRIVPGWRDNSEGILEQLDLFPFELVLPPEEAFQAVSYEDTLILPTGWEFPCLEIIKVTDSEWCIDYFLWTEEEGMSELALRLSFVQDGGVMKVKSFDDLLVP